MSTEAILRLHLEREKDVFAARQVGRDCSQNAWPNFEATCLRTTGTKNAVREARLVTADRTP